jgi:1,2-phenylacetyl-CoA epoxidase catalytic subunit
MRPSATRPTVTVRATPTPTAERQQPMTGAKKKAAKRRSLVVRRALTDTPLARAHEARLAKRAQGRPPKIPWERFDRTLYPEPALALAYDAQARLAVGEYSAVDLFARIASGLSLVGAPFDLIAAATCIPTDELRHADYAIRFAALCAGKESVELSIDVRMLEARWKQKLDLERLDYEIVEIAAIGETLACALLGACSERATDPVAKAVYDTILSDEIHHARLGWYYLAWRAPQWSQRERQRVSDRAGRMVIESEVRFGRGRDAPKGSRAAARALGVLETKGQRAAVRAVMEQQIVPGLDALGLGASHAWKVRPRVA